MIRFEQSEKRSQTAHLFLLLFLLMTSKPLRAETGGSSTWNLLPKNFLSFTRRQPVTYLDTFVTMQLAVGIVKLDIPASETAFFRSVADIKIDGTVNSADGTVSLRTGGFLLGDVNGDGLISWRDAQFLSEFFANGTNAPSIQRLVDALCRVANKPECVQNAIPNILNGINKNCDLTGDKVCNINDYNSLMAILIGTGDSDGTGTISLRDQIICGRVVVLSTFSVPGWDKTFFKDVCDMNLSNSINSADLSILARKRMIYGSNADYNGDGVVSWKDLALLDTLKNGQSYSEAQPFGGSVTFSLSPDKSAIQYVYTNGTQNSGSGPVGPFNSGSNTILATLIKGNGDVDGDGQITYLDVLKAKELIAHPENNSQAAAYGRISCDLVQNSTCDMADVDKLKQAVVNTGDVFISSN